MQIMTFDGVRGSDVQLVPSPPLLSSSGDADDGESGRGDESSLRFRLWPELDMPPPPPPPKFIPVEVWAWKKPSMVNKNSVFCMFCKKDRSKLRMSCFDRSISWWNVFFSNLNIQINAAEHYHSAILCILVLQVCLLGLSTGNRLFVTAYWWPYNVSTNLFW